MNGSEHITVCACTYKRSKLLTRMLNALVVQETDDHFNYSIVIVDNDPARSAKAIVEQFRSAAPVVIEYVSEPTVGLSYARNKALQHTRGQYIAILDDDEAPVTDWLLNLYTDLNRFHGDAVFGSVLPIFEKDPPEWITKRKVFYWRDEKNLSGAVLEKGATNNVLLKKEYVDRFNLHFDPIFAMSGGCDEDFFRTFKKAVHKNLGRDGVFVASAEAVVHEFIPNDRCSIDYIKKRHLLEGKALITILRKENNYPVLIKRFIQSVISLPIYGLIVLLLSAADKGLRATMLFKWYFHLGVLLEIFYFSPYKDRQSIGLQGK